MDEISTAEQDYTTQALLLRKLEQKHQDFVILFRDYKRYQEQKKKQIFQQKISNFILNITDKI